MIQSSTGLRAVATLFVFSCAALQPFALSIAQPKTEDSGVLPLTLADPRVPGLTTVQWKGQDYTTAEGTRVLMQVITDPTSDADLRASALEALGKLPNTDTTAQLVSLYPDLRERGEKAGVILCLTWSKGARGLPLLVHVLDNEQDVVIRLFAAGGLASWNVRRGVRELISLLESRELLTGARPIAKEALKIFQYHMNRWNYSQEEMRKLLNGKPDIDEGQKHQLLVEQIKKWWAENQHRFPNWKVGDPLPEVDEVPEGDENHKD
jgi:hypothetical protein